MNGKDHKDAHAKLQSGKQHSCRNEQIVGQSTCQADGLQIVLHLVERAQRVDGLDIAGEDKGQPNNKPGYVDEDGRQHALPARGSAGLCLELYVVFFVGHGQVLRMKSECRIFLIGQ